MKPNYVPVKVAFGRFGMGKAMGKNWLCLTYSKRGNQYLRRLLINGASANLLRSKATNADPWVIGLRQRRPSLVVAVALANKTARIAWAVMHRHENYQRVAAAA
jgi:transposase